MSHILGAFSFVVDAILPGMSLSSRRLRRDVYGITTFLVLHKQNNTHNFTVIDKYNNYSSKSLIDITYQ